MDNGNFKLIDMNVSKKFQNIHHYSMSFFPSLNYF